MKIKSALIGLGLLLSVTQPALAEEAKTAQPTESVKQNVTIDQVNLNSATAEELAKKLSGIGLKKAQSIVEYREKYGNFTQIDQITEVSGIGKATFERNRDRLTL